MPSPKLDTTIKHISAVKNAPSSPQTLYANAVPAGFPSPAEDLIEQKLSLDELLIVHPQATFFVHVAGDSMIGAGIQDGDVLVVDRMREAVSGSIVIAIVSGELTVKRLVKTRKGAELHAENPKYEPIILRDSEELMIWGVVTGVVRKI